MRFCIWNCDRAVPVGDIFKRLKDAYRECARLEAGCGDHYTVIRVPA